MRKLCKCGSVNSAEKKKMVVHPYIQLAKHITKTCLTLEVTNDNFHGVHRLELYIVAFLKNHCIANTGHKNINKIPLCC